MEIIAISINNKYYSKENVKLILNSFPNAIYLCSDQISSHNYRASGIDPKNDLLDFSRRTREIKNRINFKNLRENKIYRKWIKKFYKLTNNLEFKKDLFKASSLVISNLLLKHKKETNIDESIIELASRFMLEELSALCFFAEKTQVTFIYHKEFPLLTNLLNKKYKIELPNINFRIETC